ncbi:hypothetical protein NC652_030267 [Populus alba x Populus x berolinensis]|nr:hypothetical protein NC652_030267 [Populus alba x Populus x berolinensis]
MWYQVCLVGSDHHHVPRQSEEQMQPLPPPVFNLVKSLKIRTKTSMMVHDSKKPLLMANKGQILWMFLKAGCSMDLVDLMHCLLERMLAEL